MAHISAANLVELALDLTRNLSANDRFDRLLTTVRKTISCDAVALLAFEDGVLVPLALQGLARETLGRRFEVEQHPRFEAICQQQEPVRFSAQSTLPDPYDGLLLDRDGALPVHACMGFPLYFDQTLIGVLTLDSMTPNVFDDIPERTLAMISAMAAASLHTGLSISLLEQRAQRSEQAVAVLSHHQQPYQAKMVGQSQAMQKLHKDIALAAPSDFTVLVEGPTGVGKELVAQQLHQLSERSQAPLIYVNCAALPENLIESELFGHAKGAFTGANGEYAGKFAIADGGTIFLDEIGELPLAAQSKLLRVLQEKEIQPLGKAKVEKVDVRVIAATNRQLSEEVKQGRFREDLFHRLSIFPISVPRLKDRKGDIALLLGYFVERVKRSLGLAQIKIDVRLISYLEAYHWPGNVRELAHLVNRMALRAKANQAVNGNNIVTLTVKDCDALLSDEQHEKTNKQTIEHSTEPLKQQVDSFQRQLIADALRQHQGNWASAAKQLGVDRANLSRLAKRLGIKVSKQVQL